MWVYILKSKNQVFEKFVEWKALVETSSGQKFKSLCTDNGGEYTSAEFTMYLKKEGVRHEFTVPKTPQQNGVAERMNRTLVEAVRSMLSDAKLPKKFWAEALSTAVYLHNRSPIQQQFMVRHHLRLGPKRSLTLVISKPLAACAMHTLLRMSNRSLMVRRNAVSC